MRELLEETGLRCPVQRVNTGAVDWAVYLAEVSLPEEIRLSDEHDAYAWLALDEAAVRVKPDVVRDQLLAAARQLQTMRA